MSTPNSNTADRTAWFLFAVSLALCLVLGAAFFLEERSSIDDSERETAALSLATESLVTENELYAELLPGFEELTREEKLEELKRRYLILEKGGDGEVRHGHLLWIGWAFAILQVIFLTGCLCLGMARSEGPGPRRGLVGIGLVGAAVLTALFLSYRSSWDDAEPTLVLGFPTASLCLLFGIWTFPVLFALLYRRVFDSWYLPASSTANFAKQLERRTGAHE